VRGGEKSSLHGRYGREEERERKKSFIMPFIFVIYTSSSRDDDDDVDGRVVVRRERESIFYDPCERWREKRLIKSISTPYQCTKIRINFTLSLFRSLGVFGFLV
jgi:hypothetical protein